MAKYIAEDDFFFEIQRGNIPDTSSVHKYGAAVAVGTSYVPVTSAQVYRTPTSATALEIVSDDNTNDIASGSGARKVVIQGLDANWNAISQEVSLNGTTAVAIPTSMTRLFRMYVSESGSYASATTPSHNSTITVRVSGAGATWGVINSSGGFGLGQSQIACYTIPAGYTGYLVSQDIYVEGTKTIDAIMFTRENIDDVTVPYSPMRAREIHRNLSEHIHIEEKTPMIVFPEKTDIGYMAKAATGTSDVNIKFEIILVKN